MSGGEGGGILNKQSTYFIKSTKRRKPKSFMEYDY